MSSSVSGTTLSALSCTFFVWRLISRYILTFLFSNLISIFFCSLLHSLYRICPPRLLYYLRVNLAIRSEMNFGSLNIKTLMSAPFPGKP